MSDARSKLLNFALTHSIDKEKNKDEKKEPLEDEERNEYVEAFLQMLLPREFFDLKISNGALNRMSTLTHHFAVSLVEESIRIMESENKKEIDDRDVKKATFSVLAPVETPLQSSNTFSRYFESVDAKLKEFEGLLNRRKEWKFIKEKRNVKIMQLDNPQNPQMNFMIGSGEIQSNVEAIKNVIIDLNQWKRWDPLFEFGETVEVIDNHTKIAYLKYLANVCLIKQARDFVILTYWFQKKDGSFIGIAFAIDHPNYPEDPNSRYLRGKVISSGYEIIPISQNVCTMTYIVLADLRGEFVPEPIKSTFLNLIAERQPLNIANIRKCVTGKD